MKIETNPSISDFFRNTVKSILQDRKLQIQEGTEFYVVNLLSKATSSSLEDSDPNYFEEPLAMLFGKAFSSKNKNEQYSLLKHLGDQALFVSGFFGESLNRKIIDIDYYISMGETAYSQLHDMSKREEHDFFSETFDEMAKKFTSFVDIFSEISEQANVTNNQDILRLYERWLYTKSERLLEKLKNAGIEPTDIKKEIH